METGSKAVTTRPLPPDLAQYGSHIEYRSGQPDFSPFSAATVQIQYTGSRVRDFAAADKAAGITSTGGYSFYMDGLC